MFLGRCCNCLKYRVVRILEWFISQEDIAHAIKIRIFYNFYGFPKKEEAELDTIEQLPNRMSRGTMMLKDRRKSFYTALVFENSSLNGTACLSNVNCAIRAGNPIHTLGSQKMRGSLLVKIELQNFFQRFQDGLDVVFPEDFTHTIST